MTSDQKQLFLFGHALPGNEQQLLERMRECADKRNKGIDTPLASKALLQLPADQIAQMVAGNNYIAFLLKDHRVARINYDIIKSTVESKVPVDNKGDNAGPPPSSNAPGVSSGLGGSSASAEATAAAAAAAAASAANRTAKIRRIMMARPGMRSGSGFCRTGVIIDRNSRSRPMIPAASVPEDLIVQCQVVLQGKSREVIVRELQRTNLNVNEAVNNLLSRDDDEMDDLDESSEAYLHEELLSLLDAGLRSDTTGSAAAALLDSEGLYPGGDGYEYLISRDIRRRGDDGKAKDSGKESESAQVTQEQFTIGESFTIWGENVENDTDTQIAYPPGVSKFIKIASMASELLALADNGKIYAWRWEKHSKPSKGPHQSMAMILSNKNSGERIVNMESCGLRTVVLTNTGRVGSFMDSSCGRKLSESLVETPIEVPEPVAQLYCTTLFSAVLTKTGNVFWRGIFPFNERRKLWEKQRSKKKQVTFDTGTEIVVGSEVRTKSTPIYSVGSVAVNFTEGLPQIGILYEDAWTLNETCRFRVQTPEAYDNSPVEKPLAQKEKRVSFNLAGNRKRSAPSAPDGEAQGQSGGGGGGSGTTGETGTSATQASNSSANTTSSSKESAWNLKDVIFIHEESVHETSIVKIVDGAYCGVVFKSTLEKLEAEGANMDISKLGIRLMRKDDLMTVSASSRGARSPENFQMQFKPIRPPSSVNKIISLAVDSTGFRILCEKRNRVHLLRISTLGKLLSDHPLPINLDALCQKWNNENDFLPTVENFGDEGILLLRDATNSFQPLIRNAIGGFKELTYAGLGRIFRFGLGIHYFKTPNEVNSTTICTEQNALDKKAIKNATTGKGSNRMLLIAALIAPSPESVQPKYESLMQAILNCNLNSVKNTLQQLESASEEEIKAAVFERIDGNRNIFHVAVLNAYAKCNKDQADIEPGEQPVRASEKMDSSEAEATKARYDRKWQEMLGSSSAPTTRSKAQQQQQAVREVAAMREQSEKHAESISRESSSDKVETAKSPSKSGSSEGEQSTIPVAAKERQANAIKIIGELCTSDVISEHLLDLMKQCDVNGLTPFENAIHLRAYSAALAIWEQVESMCKRQSIPFSQILMPTMLENNDDSALFILCANDTCSYTWTGEEHTPQDIYECKTCGLVGTLCCCSECAYLCHRKHDCKLKKTSPTAYCDCWEKSECKALVAGNNTKREQLLHHMLQQRSEKGREIYEKLNSRGEHILMFLARTVGRQLIEQEHYVRRSKRPGPATSTNPGGLRIPEHDLEPPKFARKAFEIALAKWDVVSSLLTVGLKTKQDEMPMLESTFHLGEHHGSTHLDKFVFTLLAWCEESSLDILLNLLVKQANKEKQGDTLAHTCIQRFVRSVIRLFILVILLYPNAIGTLLATISENINRALPSTDSMGTSPVLVLSSSIQPNAATPMTPGSSLRESLQNYRAVAISGMLSLVRASLPAALGLNASAVDKKELKKNKILAFVAKCRRVFQTLLSYSLNELIGAADALIAPVRFGIVKPTGCITTNDDVLDLIQQHLNNEQDLSTLIKETAANMRNGANLAARSAPTGPNADMRNRENRQAANNEAANERVSDDENSNDEDDDDEETDGGPTASTYSRTRENSSASFVQRERTISDQSRRRQDTNNTSDIYDNLDEGEAVIASIEGDEDDEDDSEHDHEMDDDEEDEPYFDIHDDDDEDGEDSDNSDDENPPDVEADSNDTATVAIGGGSTEASSNTGATGGSDVRVELNSNNDNPLVELDSDLRRSEAEILISQEALATSAAVSNGGRQPVIEARSAWEDDFGSPFAPTGWTTSRSSATAASNGNNNNRGSNMLSAGGDHRAREQRSTVLRSSTTASSTPTTTAAAAIAGGAAESSPAPGTNVIAAQATNANPTAGASEDANGSSNNTSAQLAVCFSVLVKLIDELLLQLMLHAKWKQQSSSRNKGITTMLDLNPKLAGVFKEIIEEFYEPTWDWLFTVMDKTEAQLKYSNAITSSGIGPIFYAGAEQAEERREEQAQQQLQRRTEVQRRYKKRSEGTKSGTAGATTAAENEDANATRTEFFSYFLSLLRSAAAENGDDLPVIEFNALKNVCFVAEAYFFHIHFMDQLKQAELELELGKTKADANEREESLMEVDTTGVEEEKQKKLRRFYQRSNSISYPLLSTAEKHHAFTYTAADALPLSAKSHLLNAEAEREALFALPTPFRSRSAHREIASEHGVKFPTHQSLSHPPLSYSELIARQKSPGTHPPPPQDPRRSRNVPVQHYGGNKTAKECRNESKESADDISSILLNNRLGLGTSALQRALGRWSKTVALFTRSFNEDIVSSFGGDSTHSVLLNKTGVCSFNVRHAQFRKQMDRLKSTQTKDLSFTQMPRDKYSLLQQSFRQLNQHYVRRITGTSSSTGTPSQQQQQIVTMSAIASSGSAENKPPPLASHKVKVTFRDEPGEGTGVARHFYAAIAEALSTMKHLPTSPDNVNEDGTSKQHADSASSKGAPGKSASTGSASIQALAAATKALKSLANATPTTTGTAGRGQQQQRGNSASADLPPSSSGPSHPSHGQHDTHPLFYRAAKTGFFTPITGAGTAQRLNAFRNVGRLIGMCLQHMEIFPLPLSRHVFKFILGRPITWFDLAFFDPSLFDSLRSIVYNEEKDQYHPQDFYEQLEMTFSVDLPPEEGGGTLDLKANGSEIAVTRDNVLEYIYLFVEYRLLGPHLPCLEAIRRGVFDVIPADTLTNLTSEDLRLILCGTQDVNIQMLQSFTKFLDESSAPTEVLAKYKKTFWSVVNKFSNVEKQDLCFFWTGSPNLPSTEEGFQPLPTIMIRPADDIHLPTANTCISRLYVPLYSSKKILASKLLLAIKARNFGFV